MRERVLQAASVVLLLAVWAGLAAVVGTHVLPGPVDVAPNLWRLVSSGRFAEPLLTSLTRVVSGFALGFVLGLAYGIAAGRSRRFAHVTSLLFLILLFAPTLVVIFLGLMILGVTDVAVALITGLLIFPAIGIYIRDVMQEMDEDILRMSESFKVGLTDRIRGIYLPYLIPPMLSAGRAGFSHAWKIIVLSEVFGLSGGLGFEIRRTYAVFNLPVMLAWLIVFVVVLLVLEQALRITERRIVKWEA